MQAYYEVMLEYLGSQWTGVWTDTDTLSMRFLGFLEALN